MAAASTQKLQDIVECPICLKTLTEPRMLSCFHIYCQKCVHDMKEVKQETVRYECPLCCKFTAEGQLQSLPIMTQLIEASESATSGTEKCGKCKNAVPVWRCVNDCRENFCDECRSHHDGFALFQSHQWEGFSKDNRVIDKVIFCTVHTTKEVELYCRNCKQLICLVCKGTSHSTHTAETIEDALQQFTKEVKKQQVKVENKIKSTREAIENAEKQEQDTKDVTQKVKNELQDAYNHLTSRMAENYEKLSKQIVHIDQKATTDHRAQIKQLKSQLLSQQNALSLSEATMNTARNASLLKALQSGVLDSLSGSLEGADTEVEETVVTFKPRYRADYNFLGSIEEKELKISCQLEILCNDLMQRKFTPQPHSKLGFDCRRFDVINNELWCVENNSNTIHVYTSEFVKKGPVTSGAFGIVRSVVEFDDAALVSTSSGLYRASTGQLHDVKKEYDGDFGDVSVRKSFVYAMTGAGPATDAPAAEGSATGGSATDGPATDGPAAVGSAIVLVLRFNHRSAKLSKEYDFPLIDIKHPDWNTGTIQSTSHHVFVCVSEKDVIQQYALNGQLVREHGTYGSGVGELKYPLLSGSDSFNNILIAGNHNHRLDVLRTDGSFCTLPVTGLDGDVMCARIHNGKLYVVLWKSQSIKTFSIK